MPIPQEIPAVKFRCIDCNWSIVRPKQIIGDARGPLELLQTKDVTKCPKCGSANIEKTQPTTWDSINPLNSRKWDKHTGIDDLTGGKGPWGTI